MSLTLVDALASINSNPTAYQTLDDVRDLIKQVDAQGTGTVTILYSSSFSENNRAGEIASAVASTDADKRIMNPADVADFLKTR